MPKKIEYHTAGLFGGSIINRVDPILKDIDERLNELEHRVIKTARKNTTTLRQQILLFHHLGLLDKVNELELSGVKKAKLLSVLLNGSFDNIYDHLSQVHKKDSYLKTKDNYELLVKTFEEAGLKDHAKKADKILEHILKES